MKIIKLLLLLIIPLMTAGCAQLTQVGKVIMGTSTKHLEAGRETALQKTFDCTFDECYEIVLNMGEDDIMLLENGVDTELIAKKEVTVFSSNRQKRLIVIIDIPGNINTTEAGIFFTPVDVDSTRVEITSLSSSAKHQAADMVFKKLQQHHKVSKK